MEAFNTADRAHYETLLLGLSGRTFRTEFGLRLVPDVRLEDSPPLDTLIVPGGAGLREPGTMTSVAGWLRTHAPRFRRIASVCTGAYGLAAAGLLDGRRVTTHWRFAEDLARRFPRVSVAGEALFIRDGKFAREMVVYLKRPGGKEQFSEPLRQQIQAGDAFAELVGWMHGHLQRDLAVAKLAERVRMSPRHFGRRFREVFGRSPARYVEGLRLAAARDRLTQPRQTVERVAASVGFDSADVFRRRFRQRYGITPAVYRESFRTAGEGG